MNIKKIIYITHARLPTEKAHGLATVKLCEAFAKAGIEVELMIPRLWARHRADISAYYGIQKKFKITYIPALDFSFQPFFEYAAYSLRFISFSLFAAIDCWRKYRKEKGIAYFSHDVIPLYYVSFVSRNIFFDIHDFPSHSLFSRRVMKKARGFSVQTKAKIPFLKKDFGIPEEKIVYWPNGTDVEQFSVALSKKEARGKLNLPRDQKIALYAGQLFSWKGVDTLIQASRFLSDVSFYIVGGNVKDRERLLKSVPEAKNKNVYFVDFQAHETMPLWLKAADALVLPNTAKEDISRYWTSPMKLFEYMASGSPIVASRLLSIEEILRDKQNSFLAEADNPDDFAAKIKYVLSHHDEAEIIAKRAKEDVGRYTWDERAGRILQFMQNSMAN